MVLESMRIPTFIDGRTLSTGVLERGIVPAYVFELLPITNCYPADGVAIRFDKSLAT